MRLDAIHRFVRYLSIEGQGLFSCCESELMRLFMAKLGGRKIFDVVCLYS